MGAYVREIRQNSFDSHQVSPAHVLTFLRWSNRDVFNYSFPDNTTVRNPMVVYNDAIQVVVTNTKKGLAPTMTATLKGGDINYATAVHPGDFVIVNMLNWESDAERVRDAAVARQPINNVGDGFKGVFRIQNVVKDLKVNPNNGVKTLHYIITAAGFTEFNNVMYYNPAIAAAFRDKGKALWSTAIGDYYQNLLKTNSNIQIIIKALFKILIGRSYKDFDPKIKNYGNTHFLVPRTLGALLGRPTIKYANEIFNYIIGVWGASKGGSFNSSNIGAGFNPKFSSESEGNYYNTGKDLQGNKEVFLDNWNNNTAWSILQGYINNAINEIYTTYRVADDNKVYPTVVVRQKPFTTEHFRFSGRAVPVTKFLSLPRWKISANLLKSLNTSKNEAARFNFVQIFTRSLADTWEQDMSAQIEKGNFVVDELDIERQGLRPYVMTSNFDFPVKSTNKRIRAKEWAELVSDWVIDGHLKESGTLVFQGIQDPISVGDNLEFDNIVYHIESIVHSITVGTNGKKKFTTKITVSYGMDKRSSRLGPVYANMEHTDAQTQNKEDFENERILPGVSDTQDIKGRIKGEEITPTRQASFTPISLRKRRTKTKEPNTGQDDKPGKDDGGSSKGGGFF